MVALHKLPRAQVALDLVLIPQHCQKWDKHLIDSLDEPRLAVGAQALKLRESKWIGHELHLELPDLRCIVQV